MSEITQWFLKNTDSHLHTSVRVGKSALEDPASGYGVFVNLSSIGILNADSHDSKIELMRIPHNVTFDVHTVFQALNNENWYSSRQAFERTEQKFKNVFADMLEFEGIAELLNESNTLVGFLLICSMIKEEFELPTILVYYLDNVLLTTTVENSSRYVELLVDYYGQYMDSYLLEMTLERFGQFFSQIPQGIVRQLFAAVGSRCLEIPQEVDEESDDFIVNSTLVPLLDFCNHSNKPNAHFDVDRKTGDVILLLDLDSNKCDGIVEETWQEVFISYSPLIELFSFCRLYKFIPPADDYQFFNLSIQRGFLNRVKVSNKDLRLFYKWFKINPTLQLIEYKGQWYINDTTEEFALLLLAFLPLFNDFTKSCWYYDERNYETFAHFDQFLDNDDPADISQARKLYKREIHRQEAQECDVINLPQFAWCIRYEDDGEILRRRVEQSEALDLAPFDDPKQFELIIKRFKDFFLGYLDFRESELMNYHGDNESFGQLLRVELQVLKQLKTKINQNQVAFWSDMEKDAPMIPLSPFLYKRSIHDMPKENLELELETLDIEPYDPKGLTDFYDEEVTKFLHLMQD